MGTPSMRRSDRVSLTVLLEASGTDSSGQEFKDTTRTLLINRGGAVIILERELKPEQEIQIRRQARADAQKTVPARVVGEFGRLVTKTENVVCPDNPKTSLLAVLSAIRTLKEYFQEVRIGT